MDYTMLARRIDEFAAEFAEKSPRHDYQSIWALTRLHVRRGTVARVRDHSLKQPQGRMRAASAAISTARGEATRRAQRAVESPFGAELGAPLGGQPSVNAAPAVLERAQRRGAASSPPRTAKRRPSPVIGSMNPAASPASSSPSIAAPDGVDRERPEHDGRAGEAAHRRRDRAAADRAAARASSSAGRIAQRRRRRGATGRTRQTLVRPPGIGATPM